MGILRVVEGRTARGGERGIKGSTFVFVMVFLEDALPISGVFERKTEEKGGGEGRFFFRYMEFWNDGFDGYVRAERTRGAAPLFGWLKGDGYPPLDTQLIITGKREGDMQRRRKSYARRSR